MLKIIAVFQPKNAMPSYEEVDWDNQAQVRAFAAKANRILREGGAVYTGQPANFALPESANRKD